MKFLVISGAPNTGKTTAINKIAEWITIRASVTSDSTGNPLPTFLPNSEGKYKDFSIIIFYKGRKIIIHSATDDELCMNNLITKIKQNPDTEIVITSCRDINDERDYFTTNVRPYSTFFLESPLGKITRKSDENKPAAQKWYKDTLLLLHQHILSNIPFNI
jgi:GTPase SAR1 family protein